MELVITNDDFTEEEKSSLTNFHKNGCPGIMKIDDADTFKWFELYMSGKTYTEIAEITKKKRDLILYISHRLKWHDKRMKYYDDIHTNFSNKLTLTKISSMNAVAAGVMALGKYNQDIFDKFIATNDKDLIKDMDPKILQNYYKSIEMLGKLMAPTPTAGDKSPTTSINVNVGSNVNIKSEDGKNIEITDRNVGNVLKTLASIKDKEEFGDEEEDS